MLRNSRRGSTSQRPASAINCVIGGCGRRAQAKGLCHTHYVNQRDGRGLGQIRKQRPRLTEAEIVQAVAEFRAGRPIRQLAIALKITKAALQRRLTKAGVRPRPRPLGTGDDAPTPRITSRLAE